MYIASVEKAIAQPGRWIEVPRTFATEFNAKITGSCLAGGYLRVKPGKGDAQIVVEGKRYLETPAPVTPRVRKVGSEWVLSIRRER